MATGAGRPVAKHWFDAPDFGAVSSELLLSSVEPCKPVRQESILHEVRQQDAKIAP
jgi:hypothetical protein